ncbi:hypothetical protein BD769DRAFT_1669432 [Suillus cothurnatus]|nr:hypothetical protein BD769DRAFT_1669432 [Suillus cothurnatus]
MDLRPVQAKIGGDETAAKIQQLDAGLEKAKIGIGKLNILGIETNLFSGQINTLAIVIERSRIRPNQQLNGTWSEPEKLVEIQLTDTHPIILASGQHRYAALKKMHDMLMEDERAIQKQMKRLDDLTSKSDEDVDEHHQLERRWLN